MKSMFHLEFSNTAQLFGIDNSLPDIYLDNAERTLAFINELESIIGPIRVTSGYRCPKLNKLVGGVEKSDHLVALAFDFVPSQMCRLSHKRILDYLRNSYKVRYVESRPNYIHVSLNPF